ncbi:ghmp n-terminal domain-containing protein, partial [Cystoisospora suis]
MEGDFPDMSLVEETVDGFKHTFSSLLPQFLSVAPGRINIIGEHLDYEDYAVLPMAINRYTTCAIRRISIDSETHEDSHQNREKKEKNGLGCCSSCYLSSSSFLSRPRSPAYEQAGELSSSVEEKKDEDEEKSKLEKEGEEEEEKAFSSSTLPFLQIAHTHPETFPGCSVRTLEDLPMYLLRLREGASEDRKREEEEEEEKDEKTKKKKSLERSSKEEEGKEEEENEKLRKKNTWLKYVLAGVAGLLEYMIGDRKLDLIGKVFTPDHLKSILQESRSSSSHVGGRHKSQARGMESSFFSSLSSSSSSSFSLPSWVRRGLEKKLVKEGRERQACLGHYQILIGGNLPTASGLSSSSSLVVALVSSFSACMDFPLTRQEIAEISTRAERHAGTAGGGMDQAAISLSESNSATLVTCYPKIEAQSIPLPSTSVLFGVAHTLVESPKASHASTHFNKRVLECLFASLILLKKIKEEDPKKMEKENSSSSLSSPLASVSFSSLHGDLLKTWTLRKTQEACALQSFQ